MTNREEMDTMSTVLKHLKQKNQDNEFTVAEDGQVLLLGKQYQQHEIRLIKTSSDPALISGDANLRRLLFSNCRSIQTILGEPDLANRTAWIKLNALMVDFDTQYFRN